MALSQEVIDEVERKVAIYRRRLLFRAEFPNALHVPRERILDEPIAHLELSVRSSNILKNSNCEFVSDVVRLTEYELLRTPHCGQRSVQEIKEELARYGLSLGVTTVHEMG